MRGLDMCVPPGLQARVDLLACDAVHGDRNDVLTFGVERNQYQRVGRPPDGKASPGRSIVVPFGRVPEDLLHFREVESSQPGSILQVVRPDNHELHPSQILHPEGRPGVRPRSRLSRSTTAASTYSPPMNQRQVPALAVEPPRPGTELQRFHRSPAGFVDPLPYRGRQRAGVGRIRVPA